jgi:hypothetical protein
MDMKRTILLIDFVLVVGSLIAVGFFVDYARPLVIAPINDYKTTNSSILFEFEKAELILIDDNLEFVSPKKIYVEDNIIINLKPGVYYWKVLGTLESEIREFTIESNVDLKVRESLEGNYEVVNAGNTKLEVEIYDHGRFTEKIVLDVNENLDIEGDKFIGRDNG